MVVCDKYDGDEFFIDVATLSVHDRDSETNGPPFAFSFAPHSENFKMDVGELLCLQSFKFTYKQRVTTEARHSCIDES